MKFRLSDDAKRDLSEIFAYWAERTNPGIADRIADTIVERFSLLGEYPMAGKSMDGIAPGLRCFAAGRYLIYYRYARTSIEIVHVFHGARDQKRAFKRARMQAPKSKTSD